MVHAFRIGVCMMASLLLLTSCATRGGQQAGGALGGAALAGGICALVGGNAALCGGLAAAGALAGWATVAAIQTNQEKVRTAQAENQRYGWNPDKGRVIKIHKVTVVPSQVKAGEPVQVETDYSLMGPPEGAQESVTQTFALSKDGNQIHIWDPIDLPRETGGFVVSQTIPVPEGAEPGIYTLTQVLDAQTHGPVVHTSTFSVIP